ncbi:hypothetical protein ADK86_24100 [Streptomyces sp. NRRL F-5755]|nr:hypothetical protein ADK86_24100 [Streptomyces sp. NRRL F-5755]
MLGEQVVEVGQWCGPGPGELLLVAAPGQVHHYPGQGAAGDMEQDIVAGFALCRRANAGTVQRMIRRQFALQFPFQAVQAAVANPPWGGKPAGIVWGGQHRSMVAGASRILPRSPLRGPGRLQLMHQRSSHHETDKRL